MAVYRFKISFEDYDDVVREIDIKSNQTFKDLHFFFLKQIGYDPEKPSSFYVSNDQWIKNEELAYLPTQRKIDNGVALMENSRLSRFIDDPHQKFYYVYNFDKPYELHVELIKILDNDATKEFPSLFKAIGEAPKIIVPFMSPDDDFDADDADELDDNDMTLASDDELDSLNTDTEGDDGDNDEEGGDEEDEFSNEFSDDDYDDRD